MLITAIERTKKGRFSIYCDGEFACALHPDIYASSPLKPGRDIDPEELANLHSQSERRITKDRALRLLSARAYTSHGLLQKLLAYTDADSAQAAVARMAELGLIDDLDYARRYAAECLERKGFSLSRTKQALREKGIPRDVIDEALEEARGDPEPAIARVILRKYLPGLDTEKGENKATNALLRLGYRHGDIRRVMENLREDTSYYDEWE
jgi:regulatory protein